MMEVMTHSEFVFLVLSGVGWIHSWTEIMLLPFDRCAMITAKPVIFGFFGTASSLVQPLAP